MVSADDQTDNAPQPTRAKRNFSGLTLREAMRYAGQGNFIPWQIGAEPRTPSVRLTETLERFDWFGVIYSEASKLLFIDALLVEIVPNFAHLRVWKDEPINTDTLVGVADYLLCPKLAYVETPLLCAIEAKKDDFTQGAAQCVGEMVACRNANKADGHDIDIYGIVSNGQTWEFYRLAQTGEIYQTAQYGMFALPELLGALYHVCAACDANVPLVKNEGSARFVYPTSR